MRGLLPQTLPCIKYQQFVPASLSTAYRYRPLLPPPCGISQLWTSFCRASLFWCRLYVAPTRVDCFTKFTKFRCPKLSGACRRQPFQDFAWRPEMRSAQKLRSLISLTADQRLECLDLSSVPVFNFCLHRPPSGHHSNVQNIHHRWW